MNIEIVIVVCLLVSLAIYVAMRANSGTRQELFEPQRAAFNIALELLPDPVVVLDRDCKITYANTAAAFVGIKSGLGLLDALINSGMNEVDATRLSALCTDDPKQNESIQVELGSEHLLVQITVSPVFNSRGEREGTLLVGRDFTQVEQQNRLLEAERARLAEAVSEEQQRRAEAEALMEAVANVSQSDDLNSTLDTIAQQALQVIGSERAQVWLVEELDAEDRAKHGASHVFRGTRSIDQMEGSIKPDDDFYVDMAKDPLGRLMLAKPQTFTIDDVAANPVTAKHPVFKNSDRRSWLSVSMNGQGQLLGLLTFSFSSRLHSWQPNEIKLAEAFARYASLAIERQRSKELRMARDAAEAANKAKSQFLSRMSHELRTPLNAILGFGQLLEAEELSVEQNESVRYILYAGRHLLQLVNETLDIARIEQGRIDLECEAIYPSVVLHEAVEMMRPLARERNIKVELTPNVMSSPPVLGDRQRINQVLINLISNAIKYGREGGSVVISSQQVVGQGAQVGQYQRGFRSVARGRAEQSNANGLVRFTVTDAGPGISAEHLECLFTPFERLGAEATIAEGSGLGLALCKLLVEAMGGSIGVESKLGSGSTFWFELALGDEGVVRQGRERQEKQGELVGRAMPDYRAMEFPAVH